MKWLDSITNSTDTSLSKLQETVKNREAGVLQSMGSQGVRHDLATEQQQRNWEKSGGETREGKVNNYCGLVFQEITWLEERKKDLRRAS